eukprot:1339018-Pleurochrysis_carterae.AAC.1
MLSEMREGVTRCGMLKGFSAGTGGGRQRGRSTSGMAAVDRTPLRRSGTMVKVWAFGRQTKTAGDKPDMVAGVPVR